MFAGPYTHGTHVCVWVRGRKPLIHDSWKTTESEVGRHCFLNVRFAVPCVLIHARSWPFCVTPRGGGRQGSNVPWLGGKEEEVDFISDYLWAEPHGRRSADRTLVATSGLALIRTWRARVVFAWWGAQLGYVYFFQTKNLLTEAGKRPHWCVKTIHSHLCHLARPPWHSRGRECQPTDFSSTKHFHRKDPVNFLFPWPRGGGGRQRVSLCQMLRALQHASATHSFRTSKSALAVSLQAGQHLTVFVQNWCCFLTPNDKKTNMLQDVLSAFILHPCWTLAMKPTYQEEMIGGE